MPPLIPYIVTGTVMSGPIQDRESISSTIDEAEGGETINFSLDDGSLIGDSLTVTLTHSSGTLTETTNSDGVYLMNLADLDSFSDGDSFTIVVTTITETDEDQERAHKAAKAMKVIPVDQRGDEYTLDYPIPVNVIGGVIRIGTKVEKLMVDDTGTVTYLGYAPPGSSLTATVWKIKRVTNASGNTEWADGNGEYDNGWSNRTNITYS